MEGINRGHQDGPSNLQRESIPSGTLVDERQTCTPKCVRVSLYRNLPANMHPVSEVGCRPRCLRSSSSSWLAKYCMESGAGCSGLLPDRLLDAPALIGAVTTEALLMSFSVQLCKERLSMIWSRNQCFPPLLVTGSSGLWSILICFDRTSELVERRPQCLQALPSWICRWGCGGEPSGRLGRVPGLGS